jgi:hypothetical protein
VNKPSTDIFSARLTSQAFAAAAAREFHRLIQDHSWQCNTGSLTRLSNLLLNVHVAKHTTSLTFYAYRFSFDDTYDASEFANDDDIPRDDTEGSRLRRHLTSRNNYVTGKIRTQLTKILQRAHNLTHLTFTPDPLHHASTIQTLSKSYHTLITNAVSNPLAHIQYALQDSHAHRRLESITLRNASIGPWYTKDQRFCISTGLTCPNITTLTLDPTYFVEPAFHLYCPHLRHMELVGFEHTVVWDLAPLHERRVPSGAQCKLREMFSSIRSVTFTGDGTPRNLDKIMQSLHVATLYALLAYLARYTRMIPLLKVRATTIVDDGGVYGKSAESVVDGEGNA